MLKKRNVEEKQAKPSNKAKNEEEVSVSSEGSCTCSESGSEDELGWFGLSFPFCQSLSSVFASSSSLSCCFAGFVPSYAVLSLTCSISELALPIILFFFLFLIFSFCALFLFHASFVLPSVPFPFLFFFTERIRARFRKGCPFAAGQSITVIAACIFFFLVSEGKERLVSACVSFFRSIFAPPSSLSSFPSCIFTAVFSVRRHCLS